MEILIISFLILLFFLIIFWLLKILLKESISDQLIKLNKNEYIKINNNLIISIYGIFLIDENNKIINKKYKYFIRKIKKYLSEYSEIIFHQIIINDTKNIIINNNPSVTVIKLNELFMNIMSKRDKVYFTYNQIYEIANKLKKRKKTSQKNICPYCGGKIIKTKIGSDLILYTGTNDLYICSNSPKCKYSRTYNRIDNPFE